MGLKLDDISYTGVFVVDYESGVTFSKLKMSDKYLKKLNGF